MHGVEVFRHAAGDPWWRDALPGFRHATPAELPPGYVDGYAVEVPLIETPRYMRYLVARFIDTGGRIFRRDVKGVEEPLAACAVVVNCSGLGARELVGDASMLAIRGQITLAAPRPGRGFLLDEQAPTYIIPRSDGWVLGGTATEGSEDLTPDPAIARAIMDRCAALEPSVRSQPVLGHAVGLRPGRPAIRLEAEHPAPGKTLIHNYGHGGAGVTLSWGCAAEVLKLLAAG